VEFSAYLPGQVVDILRERATAALAPESWCEADLNRISQAAARDARVAIQTLRVAAYVAEKAKASQVRVADIDAGTRQSRSVKRVYLLRSMSEHHQLLHRIVKDARRMGTRDLWQAYLVQAKQAGLPAMSKRAFNNYKLHLVQARLLRERQGPGRANARFVEVVEDELQ